jgi:CubicO group peptidase (beta-lactamase class C family)
MKSHFFLCLALLAALSSRCLAEEAASSALPRSTPEKQGISSAAILSFVQAADAKIDAMHSFMLVRYGQVVAEGWWEPCAASLPHTMLSLSKSFASTAVGLAISDGKLSLDDPVVKFFPEDAPAQPSDNLKAMRVRDLLTMSSGQHADVVPQFRFDTNEPLTREFLALPVEHKPGTFWFYNTPGSYMLSAIVQKVTGLTTLDYLRPRLFEPLGIENPIWDASRQGISLGGYGLHIKTEDIARFGLLYLNKGKWHGKQLVPASWVAAATARQASNGSNPQSDWEQGYGYQFWQCRHGLYRGDGAFGQFCIVMPEQDAVVAMTAGTTNTASMMNLVWDILLPAMQAKPLHSDSQSLQKLHQALAELELHRPQGAAAPAPAVMSGRKFLFAANDQKLESASLEFGQADGSVTLGMRCHGIDQKIRCGQNAWEKSRMTFVSDVLEPPAEQPVAASGAWTADGVYTVKLAFYETPFCATLTFRFAGDQMFYTAEYNAVRRQPAKLPTLTGRAGE